jgi:TPR repeat protein
MRRLASLQANGNGVPRDMPAALAVLEPACAGGVLEACGRLALVLLNRGEQGDRDRARSLLETACGAGDQPSCTLLKQLVQPAR